MAKQIIVSISREFGSGGRDIAILLAEKLGIRMYDKDILREIAKEKNSDLEMLKKYDEKPRNMLLTRRVGEYTNSMEENLVKMQFDFIRKKAEEGESFVIVGRCAETVLQDYDCLVSVFVTGDADYKIGRIQKQFSLNESDAAAQIEKVERQRRQYHNRYSDHKWGDSRFYDMCINGSRLGVEGTTDILENYVRQIMERR